ncbi:MAG: hypothetical protein H6708_00315 [Kofleriaceae bacterium]|nr:hypothetical protein [Kofleriaceae bacterium]
MGDIFVDASYRGLELGRRLKLRDVRPQAGYLEHPLPMPVGTEVTIDAGDGVTIPAVVTDVHEQVGGRDQTPGMKIQPALDGAAAAWWQARVDAAAMAAEAEAEAAKAAAAEARAAAEAEAAAKAATEAEAKAAAEAEAKAAEAPAAAVGTSDGVVEDAAGGESGATRSRKNRRGGRGKKSDAVPEPTPSRPTVVMSAVAIEEALAAPEDPPDDGLVDDGRKTVAMAALDVSMITGEPPPDVGLGGDESGEISIEAGDGGDAGEAAGEVSGEVSTDDGDDDAASTSGSRSAVNGDGGNGAGGKAKAKGSRRKRGKRR